MKKRIKIFQTGSYPQGEFSDERVNKIFNGVQKVDGVYAHTSKWVEKGEQPLSLGEFSNFKVDKGIVTADVEFNEKGKGYFNDGVIKGVSVEIRDDKLSKVALLPIGVKPAVAGAEFEEAEYANIEFEEVIETTVEETVEKTINAEAVKNLTLDERMKILTAVLGSLTNEEKENIRKIYWADFEKVEPKKSKTEEEIRAEITAEFELKAKGEELKATAKTKFPPIAQPIVEFAIDEALKHKETIEFEEADGTKSNISYFEKLEKEIEAMPKATNFKSVVEDIEFGEAGEEQDIMEAAKQETKKIYGGDK